MATFSGGAAQHGGFALDFGQNLWAIFSTQSGGALFARTHDGITPTDTPLPGNWLGSPHAFRIDWASGLVKFYIDGTLVASHAQSIPDPMRPAFSEFSPGADALLVSSVRLAPYATAGTFTSRILDAGSSTVWASASSVATTPAGTTLALSVRFGDTPTPDATWTSFSSVALGSAALTGTSRYVQYRAVMTGTGDTTPELASITLSGTAVAPLPTVSVTGGSIVEGNSGSAYEEFTVTLSAPRFNQVSVSYSTSDGTASAGSDYQASSGTILIPAGSTTASIVVPITGDVVVEADETFAFTLSAPVNATLGQAQATGTIVDDDVPSISIADALATEGDGGTTNAVFVVSLSVPAFHTVTVPFTTTDGTALAPQDYTATSGVVTFPAGTTTRDINVPVVGDSRHELSKNFAVILGSPVNAVVQDGSATGVIADNDPIPAVTIDDLSTTEGDSGSLVASVTVRLSRASDQVVTLSYATADVTAASPADFTASAGTLTFAAGEITKTIGVSVTGDTVDEPDETFAVNLGAPVNATIADAQAIVTIVDNDPPGPNENARMAVDRTGLYFGATNNGAIKTGLQTANVRFTNGTGTWSVTTTAPWIQIGDGTGSGAGTFLVGVKPGTYPSGTILSGTVTVTAPGVPNSPLDVPVQFRAYAGTAVPDGTVDTPADNAQSVVGSLAVTGWAVDDIGVSRVSIWRDPLPGEPTSGPEREGIHRRRGAGGWREPGHRRGQVAAIRLPVRLGLPAADQHAPATRGTARSSCSPTPTISRDIDALLGSKTITCDNAHCDPAVRRHRHTDPGRRRVRVRHTSTSDGC